MEEAERTGDLSSALSKLDRVLDLDKQAPEPSRTGTYQREYEKVHSEHESLKAARSEDGGTCCAFYALKNH